MTATILSASRSQRRTTKAPKQSDATTRRVQEVLLELAYLLHATRVVKRIGGRRGCAAEAASPVGLTVVAGA